ncbi:hypothetical protein HY948_04920 [Candidatus Gottesmanbacteria bacterium]|nr:hypothetical protein [Candidatus Gottesmanbacteria bacterium]
MKRVFLIGFLLVSVAAATAVIVVRKNQNRPLPVSKVSVVDGPDKFGRVRRDVVFTYSGSAVALPASLPTYTMMYPSDLPEKTAALAKTWGFTSPLSQPVEYVYDWIDNDKHLSYNSKSKNVSFSFFASAAEKQAPALTPQDVLSSLTTLGILSNDFSFVETNRQTIRPEGEGGDKTRPPLTVISYQSKIKDRAFPFFFSSVTRTAGEVRVNPTGNVVSFSFYATAAVKQEQERETLTLDRAMQELRGGKGYLVGLSDEAAGYGPETPPEFTEVKISSVVPAFLFVPEEARFVPIYVIEGSGYGESVQRVRYFLRASS